MIVSVTVLGAVGRSQDAIADDIVDYFAKGRAHSRAGQRPGSVIELPSPDGGTVAYYADSAGLRPARWLLGESGEVDPRILKGVLAGVHPATGERLLSGSGHADRSEHARTDTVRPEATAEWYSAREAAAILGVSDSFVQRHCRKAVLSGDDAAMAGIERSDDGRSWRIHRDALERLAVRRQPKRIVVGYDLTYSVPKSVSVLWAGGDDTTRAEVLDAFDEAVTAGTRYFDRHALVVRARGEQQRAEDIFAADYLHVTNRALEPQLHHHVLVANYGKTTDGEGRALDARMLFLHAKTASYLAGAELRHQLTARLGVRWGEIVNGIAEIEGVPEAARAEMSTRSKEIAAALDELGFGSARARQVAALDTRAAKEHGVDIDALMAVWDERLSASGYGQSEREAVLRQVDAPSLVAPSELERLFADLSRIAGITANEAIFDRRRVVQVLSEFAADRLSGDAIDELADRFLTQPAVVQLQGSVQSSGNVIRRDDGRVVVVPGDAIYSTRAMLELEARAIAFYERGRQTRVGVVADEVLTAVLAEERFARLSDEQRRFVERLTTSGMRIQAALGAAGSGKTTALEAAVEAWSRAGYTVVGAAVGGTQTVVLGEEAHVEARTVASVIARYFNFGNLESIDAHTVLLVDEASLLSTQDFALLAQAVEERGALLRIVGDTAQHSAVAAGGIFRHLVETHPDEVPALTHIYRQQGAEMAEVRLANAEYREGKISEALERLERDGRITEAESAEQAIDLLTCAWYAERERRRSDPDRRPSSMTAEHHFERVALNARARVLLQADGTLSGSELNAAGLSFQRGDEVIARIGDHDLRADGAPRRSWVRNGSLGVVREVANDHLVVEFERWGTVVVPQEYIEREVAPGIRGALQHAYALTTYAAQGSTYAVASPLITDASSRPGVYVGVTRGQFNLKAVIIRRRTLVLPLTDDRIPMLVDETDALRAAARRLEAEVSERLASEVDPSAARIHELAQHQTLPDLARAARLPGADRDLYGRALHERARIVGARAVVDPGEDVFAHLGVRPTGGPARVAWDQAVATIAVWREREQAVPVADGRAASWALGEWPSDPRLDADYEAVVALVGLAERWRSGSWSLVGGSDEPTEAPMLSEAAITELVLSPPSWRELGDDELRGVARGIDRAIVTYEIRLGALDEIAALRVQLGRTSTAEADSEVPEEQGAISPSAISELATSLERYRALAVATHDEAVRRGLASAAPDFLGAGADSPYPEPQPFVEMPEGPVLRP